jgi:voltage-gated potassium channel Kch
MSKRVTTAERLRYAFDRSMAAGPIALIGWLTLISIIAIVLAAAFLSISRIAPDGAEPLSFGEAAWASLMRTMDAGTMGGDNGWSFRVVTLVVTLFGIFVFSSLISILSAGVNSKIEELRKGRSRVLEDGHTIILNWSPSIFDVVSELAIANSNQRHACIVIMADRDKVSMEDEIAAKIETLGRTRIVCRSGDPTDLYDLTIVNPQASKSIIVLSPEGDDPDSRVIKTVLALVHDPRRRKERYRIAAEIRDARNGDVARVVAGGEAQLIMADELIAKIVVHSSRQAGLSAVYSELLDFEGCEIYTTEQPSLTGKTFGDAVMQYDVSSLIGICQPDGRVRLNPPAETIITVGARVVIVAEDDDRIKARTTSPPGVDVAAIVEPSVAAAQPERTLILGWNRRGRVIVSEALRYLGAGSKLTIAATAPGLEQDLASIRSPAEGVTLEHKVVDTSDRTMLDALSVEAYDHVIVLGYSDIMAAQSADTRTLITLLHLRKIAERTGAGFSVVSEMTDVRNRELAEVTRANDFVVSNKLVSLMLAQASENQYLAAIFDELLDEKGAEIYMRPVGDYVTIDRPVNFFTIAEAARRRGQIAFGYCRAQTAGDDQRMGGVVVNPPRSEALHYEPGDRIIVLALD